MRTFAALLMLAVNTTSVFAEGIDLSSFPDYKAIAYNDKGEAYLAEFYKDRIEAIQMAEARCTIDYETPCFAGVVVPQDWSIYVYDCPATDPRSTDRMLVSLAQSPDGKHLETDDRAKFHRGAIAHRKCTLRGRLIAQER